LTNRVVLFIAVWVALPALCIADAAVGPAAGGGYVVPTRQLIRPAGQTVEFGARPVDLMVSPDGGTVYVMTNSGVVAIRTAGWKIIQQMGFDHASASYHGMAMTRDGSKLYVSTSAANVLELLVGKDGTLSAGRRLAIPGPGEAALSSDEKIAQSTGKAAARPVIGGSPVPCGIALSPGEGIAYVCLSRSNALCALDLASGKVIRQMGVGIAPYDVALSPDGMTAWVSNWGGRMPREGERTEMSSGTPIVVDDDSTAASGTVSLIDLRAGKEIAQVEVGLHPCDLALDAAANLLYVANANSDTVSVIDTAARKVSRTIEVKPDDSLPFGSAPNALAINGDTVYVANGGNNAVAVVDSSVRGFIPTGWYPGALATDGAYLYIANVKGYGSRNPGTKKAGDGGVAWQVHAVLGVVQKVALPGSGTLGGYTRQVREDSRVPQALLGFEKAQTGVKPVPVPQNVGEPTPIEHVVYIIKENKTYDQVFGDMSRANSDPTLCVFGRQITPNQHALADTFVLLDNYYCNCVCSADGHQWVTQGYVTDYLEKGYGGWPRCYPYEGNDALTYSSAGFIWDNVLLHGLSFRNYGEMSTDTSHVKASFAELLADKSGANKFSGRFGIEALRRYSCANYPGWTLAVPDQNRADVFLREFAECEKTGEWPSFVTILLPNDHTAGLNPRAPTPRAYVADNDLAVGRIVEAVSKSKFWPATAIFVIEDDPQSGYDHVDGHRSTCLVISPYTKRGEVLSNFYNQTSVLHTIELILGIAPMNQIDAMAPVMRECFVDTPDLTAYTAIPSNVPLDETNPTPDKQSANESYWAGKSMALNFDEVDAADNDTLNRVLWFAMKGPDTPYPAEFAGAHGKGLKALNLALRLEPQ
jgi:YVTN family beta-propeller protein